MHFTGGEPLARADLEALVERAHARGMYTNLVTSGVPLERARLEALASRGLDHVQLSFQGATANRRASSQISIRSTQSCGRALRSRARSAADDQRRASS